MPLLLAGLLDSVPGQTLNRLCASDLHAVSAAGRRIRSGELGLEIPGGVKSMTCALFVMAKTQEAFSRSATTIGSRFINSQPVPKAQYGVDAMPETAENVGEKFQVFALAVARRRPRLPLAT